jgi:rod shape-determining protein MreC
MYRLLLFLRRIHVLLIFLLLEGLALHFYASSSVHSRARLLTASDAVFGGAYGVIAGAERFVGLSETNRQLEKRVEKLEDELSMWRERYGTATLDSINSSVSISGGYIAAHVVRNSISKRENYIMLDRGLRDGVERRMAVVSPQGSLVGYVEGVSASNAVCVSVLSTDFRASGMFPASGHFGSVSWLGGDPRTVRLSEVPKYAEVGRGDTVVTRSSLNFPEGIIIGTVESYTVDESRASLDIDVRLSADIAALRTVFLVRNLQAAERTRLEEATTGTASE